MEPEPGNVTGQVVHRHAFEHRINWSYIALAAAVLVLALLVYDRTEAGGSVTGKGNNTLTGGVESNTNG